MNLFAHIAQHHALKPIGFGACVRAPRLRDEDQRD